MQRELGITTIYVTHDQEEALSMSDRIVVMNEGRVEQIGTPFEIYNYPRTRFVASFVGTLNILRGRVHRRRRRPDRDRRSGDRRRARHRAMPSRARSRSVALRPEAVSLDDAGRRAQPHAGTIEEVSFLGAVVRIRVRFRENAISLDTFNNPALRRRSAAQPATVSFAREDLLVLEGAEAV